MIASMGCEVLVIGHGAAGCLAAAYLASRGADVMLVGRGVTATELSTARISLPGEGRGTADLLRSVGEDHGLYLSPVGRVEAMTNMGTTSLQDLTSPHDWLMPSGGRTAVLGLRGNDDLDPDLACAMLSRHRGLDCDPFWADPGIASTVWSGRGPLSEEAMDAVERLAAVITELGQDTVVIPPLFAGPRYGDALRRLEQASGRVVREPATPLSNPGRRLQDCLVAHAARSGCRLLMGREVQRMEFSNGRAASASVRSGLREMIIEFKVAVLATGGLVGSGLEVSGENVIDPMGAFAVGGPGGPALTAALSSGILHREGRALRSDGTVVPNVLLAGSALPGNAFPLGRGLGVAISSAIDAASLALEEL